MEKITVREFRSGLSAYLKRIADGEVFEVNGVHIGKVDDGVHAKEEDVYTPVTTPRVHADRKEEIARLQALADSVKDEPPTVAGFIKQSYGIGDEPSRLCEQCGVEGAEKIVYVEGDEVEMCKSCIKRMYVGAPKMLDRIYNKMPNIK